uniref:GRF-type domain-containing protein n=1 Tax=Chenopodium quinoa TaxID=63459 RepID=A0A803MU94_CHEQI
MASHNSIGSSSRSRSKQTSSSQVVCYHNEIAPLRTVHYDGPTKGKRFFGCSYWPEQRTCGFFKWADEVDDVCDLQHLVMEKETRICELEYEMDMMKDKVKRLKAKKEKLVEEVEEMGIATTETMFELKENNTDKRLMLTLVFSWAFFTLVLLMK